MLKKVTRPDDKTVSFEYDAMGRRTAKIFANEITRWIWDGNTPLHEWQYELNERPKTIVDASGMLAKDQEEPTKNLITWVFDEGTFKPAAKIENGDTFSIISDYLGTPAEAYDSKGQKVWEMELETYGKVKSCKGGQGFVPFRFQGQYEDIETGLYYNRFRYYGAEEAIYISQDPIGLQGGARLSSYVHDPNSWVDVFGLGKDKGTQRWKNHTRKDGKPYSKLGPKTKGTGDHNAKIDEIIKRESAKPGVEHVGGGSQTEITLSDLGGAKDERRMDASFKRADGSVYHINVGKSLDDGVTGIAREREALDHVTKKGHEVTFEAYGKDADYRKACK